MSAERFLDRMSKDLIDRNHLLKVLETIKSIAEIDSSGDKFIEGINTAIEFIKLEKTEY
ncbi:hypothetical protein SAMN05421821_105154 [Mucilaginibacter lappiensis]|uniref:Uncharacterized protein n=1 Tax=Mucilaginibacter lappiensis TaxID=354630 RepID=A0ABR6PIY1_9SPHI|nr:hypothetical protein [Mucilaginibacter lappiensis]MBB6109736.1 hypothetical protein [Mucilaginibacter lappiensis]SIR13658.1 hypothetical protein SAMN05421821_105154 [Mucilaginibacter lappiensis]